MSSFFRKLRWWAQRRDKEAELREELRFHLEEEAEEKQERGLSENEAGRAARLEFGNLTRVEESTRAEWGWPRWEQVARDAGYGLRQIRRNPTFRLSPSRHWRWASAGLQRCSAPFIRC